MTTKICLNSFQIGDLLRSKINIRHPRSYKQNNKHRILPKGTIFKILETPLTDPNGGWYFEIMNADGYSFIGFAFLKNRFEKTNQLRDILVADLHITDYNRVAVLPYACLWSKDFEIVKLRIYDDVPNDAKWLWFQVIFYSLVDSQSHNDKWTIVKYKRKGNGFEKIEQSPGIIHYQDTLSPFGVPPVFEDNKL